MVATKDVSIKFKLKLFQYIQKLCHTMGFLTLQPNPSRSFQLKILLHLLPPILCLVPSVMFLLTEANSMQDYELSIFVISSIFECVACISVMIWNVPHILEVIEKFEEIIEKSKFRYTKY